MINGEVLVQMLADPKGLTVTPIIDPDAQIGEASIDIRLGPDIIVARRATGATSFDPSDGPAFREALRRRQAYVRRGLGDSFHLQPNEFVIARSLEYVQLPDDVRAQALGRSSWGRLGLVVATATLIQPGFKGTITLELTNLGNTPIVLQVGLPIAQLAFTRDGEAARQGPSSTKHRLTLPIVHQRRRRVSKWWKESLKRRRSSRYDGQLAPAPSHLDRDPDLWWVAPIAVKCVVGVIGERFSGKSSVASFLVSRANFRIYRLTQFVYEEALRQGADPADVPNLRRLGDELREEWGPDVLARLAFSRIRSELLDSDRSRRPAGIVIESFKVPEELQAWQRIDFFKTMLVTSDPLDRLDRAMATGSLNREIEDEPLPEADSEKIEWLRRWVDHAGDGGHPAKPLIDQAREDVGLIEVSNRGGVDELFQQLRHKVKELEGWARERPF